MNSVSMEKARECVLRRSELEKELANLYVRRAGKEKHISRIIPEYSEDWANDSAVKDSDKKGEEKMMSAEMVMLVAERRDLCAGEEKINHAIERRLKNMGRIGMHFEEMEEELIRLQKSAKALDEAAATGQRIIRQTGHIKRCMDQALKFRVGSGGLSEPLRIALRGVDELEPMMQSFYTIIEEPAIKHDMREKIKYCQIGGADWAWEAFDLDVVGLFARLFHRPDMKRFSEVDVELLDVRFRVYNAMSRVAVKRSIVCEELIRLAETAGVLDDAEHAEVHG
ncbi:MAG: hypothetical protein IJE08_08370 [Clostridia bacterium]|nr:hypothetical protein [Clostridia bacterium]